MITFHEQSKRAEAQDTVGPVIRPGCQHTALWAAVIAQAIEDLGSRHAFIRRNAAALIASNAWHTGSFNWCCQVLAFPADKVRRMVLSVFGNSTKRYTKNSTLATRAGKITNAAGMDQRQAEARI